MPAGSTVVHHRKGLPRRIKEEFYREFGSTPAGYSDRAPLHKRLWKMMNRAQVPGFRSTEFEIAPENRKGVAHAMKDIESDNSF